MYILAIETTGPYSSVALINEKKEILGYESSKETMDHLRGLMPMIISVLSSAGIEKKDLTAVAVSQGPGSFTGIRIGVSTGRALAQALGIKTIAVPTLSQYLYRKEDENLVCTMIDARRRQVYGFLEGFMGEEATMFDDVMELVKTEVFSSLAGTEKGVTFYGNGAILHQASIREQLDSLNEQSEKKLKYSIASEDFIHRDARAVAAFAVEKALDGQFLEYGELFPEYMRKAEAEEKLAAGQLPICKGPKQE